MVPPNPPDSEVRRISEKGWVVIPQAIRDKYGLDRGVRVRFVDYGGVLSIVPVPDDPARAGRGLHRNRPLTQRLLEERRRDKQREEKGSR